MTPLIAVDICNTLADVNGQIARIAGGKGHRDIYGLEDLGYLEPERFFEAHPEVFTRANPVPNAVRAMHTLSSRFQIAYVSARPEWAREITQAWLRANKLPPGPLYLTKDKAAVMRRLRPLLAIEDSPVETARITPVCPVLVISQPYNRGAVWPKVLASI